jgi:hypothetical protein
VKCRECEAKLSYWEELLGDRCAACVRDEDPPELEEEYDDY